MSKQLSDSQLRELGELYQSCVLTLDTLASNGLERRQVDEMRTILDAAYARRMLTGVRNFRSELAEWARDLPREAQVKLREALVAAGLQNPDATRAKELDRIQKALKRGRIVSDNEYALVLGRVEELFSDSQNSAEVLRLNELLTAYSRG